MRTRSGSTILSKIFARRYSGCFSRTRATESATSATAWWNSGSAGFFALTSASSAATYSFCMCPSGLAGVFVFGSSSTVEPYSLMHRSFHVRKRAT